MKTFGSLLVGFLLAACGGTSPPGPSPPPEPLVVLNASGALSAGFNLFVNTDRQRIDWLSTTPEGLLAAYPEGQQFGFIAAVLAGESAPGSRPVRDLSVYRTLHVQLRGAAGGESVEIGIKDNTDPDDG